MKTTKTERPEQIMACLMKIMDENVSFDVEDWVNAQKDDPFCRQIYKTLKEKPVSPADQVDSSRETAEEEEDNKEVEKQEDPTEETIQLGTNYRPIES